MVIGTEIVTEKMTRRCESIKNHQCDHDSNHCVSIIFKPFNLVHNSTSNLFLIIILFTTNKDEKSRQASWLN